MYILLSPRLHCPRLRRISSRLQFSKAKEWIVLSPQRLLIHTKAGRQQGKKSTSQRNKALPTEPVPNTKSGTFESVNPGYFTFFFTTVHPSLYLNNIRKQPTNYMYNFCRFRHEKSREIDRELKHSG